MKTIKLQIKDNIDLALLLTGINIVRKGNLVSVKAYLDLPKRFKKDKIIDELVSDYDRLNTLGAQLSKLMENPELLKD